MLDSTQYCMVLTTVNSESIKKDLLAAILERKLAACIQTIPIHSHYMWEGKVCEDSEQLLILKTEIRLYSEIEKCITDLHNYDVPQIVQVPFINGFDPYLTWISKNVD